MFKKQRKYKPIDKKKIKGFNKIRDTKATRLLCHAPFQSMLFSQYGQVLGCFYNKRELIGRYPENSISEIIHGEKLARLRDHIRHNDLSYGCEECARNLVLENFYSVGAWKYDYLAAKDTGMPTSFDFQISNVCNLKCVMCSGEYSATVRVDREAAEPYRNPYDAEFLRQIREYLPHLREMSFTGGETFMIPVYYDIWEMIYEVNPSIRISITTNGTIFNEKVKQILEKLNFNITISVDSVQEDTYQHIRSNANLAKMLKNLDAFHEYTLRKGTTINVKACPMRQNIFQIHELVAFFSRKDIPLIFNTVLFPPDCSIWNEPASRLEEYIRFLSEHEPDVNTNAGKDNLARYQNLIRQITNWKKEAEDAEKTYNFMNISIRQLLDIIRDNVLKFTTQSDYLNDADIETKSMEYFDKLTAAIFKIQSDEGQKNAAVYFMRLPVDRLIGELEIRDDEKLYMRAIQASKVSY
ncbi:MAG: radical SAM protein [Bacteroidetes bacterium]|nr:radical SAM protein [Bacteroidota bacterium]MBU1718904.1 radical SAM protein [Bacteroidota bacterium]MBU1901908.1 radical SAM protein [Patescibacteria group bacterium]